MKHRDNLLWTFPRAAIVVLLLLFCTINTTPAQTILSAEDIAEKALAATVYLEMQDKNGKTLGIGSEPSHNRLGSENVGIIGEDVIYYRHERRSCNVLNP